MNAGCSSILCLCGLWGEGTCWHLYCQDCIVSLFKASIEDDSFFPPRCYRQSIEMNLTMDFLEPKLQVDLRAKSVEFPTENRTRSSRPPCSQPVSPSMIKNNIGTCRCRSLTCSICKAEAHVGECPDDPAALERYVSWLWLQATRKNDPLLRWLQQDQRLRESQRE